MIQNNQEISQKVKMFSEAVAKIKTELRKDVVGQDEIVDNDLSQIDSSDEAPSPGTKPVKSFGINTYQIPKLFGVSIYISEIPDKLVPNSVHLSVVAFATAPILAGLVCPTYQ